MINEFEFDDWREAAHVLRTAVRQLRDQQVRLMAEGLVAGMPMNVVADHLGLAGSEVVHLAQVNGVFDRTQA